MSKPGTERECRGFSLIEVLVAVVVTAVIIAMMGQVLGGSLTVWKAGTRQVDMNAIARAVLDVIADDLTTAASDNFLAFQSNIDHQPMFYSSSESPAPGDPYVADEILFLSFTRTPDSATPRRSVQAIRYWVQDIDPPPAPVGSFIFELHRNVENVSTNPVVGAFNPYTGFSLPGSITSSGRPLAQNVAEVNFICYDDTGAVLDNFVIPGTPPSSPQPPAWIDVYLALLSEEDARQAAQILSAQGGANARQFVDTKRRGYMTRVYIRNRPIP